MRQQGCRGVPERGLLIGQRSRMDSSGSLIAKALQSRRDFRFATVDISLQGKKCQRTSILQFVSQNFQLGSGDTEEGGGHFCKLACLDLRSISQENFLCVPLTQFGVHQPCVAVKARECCEVEALLAIRKRQNLRQGRFRTQAKVRQRGLQRRRKLGFAQVNNQFQRRADVFSTFVVDEHNPGHISKRLPSWKRATAASNSCRLCFHMENLPFM